MSNFNFDKILRNFIDYKEIIEIGSFGSGHINDTFIVLIDRFGVYEKYILQRLNTNVFKNPEDVLDNIEKVCRHLEAKIVAEGGNPKRETTKFLKSTQNRLYFNDEENNYWRAYHFIDDAKSYDIVENPTHFYNAARAFGKFLYRLNDFPAESLYESLPDFHNTKKRYLNFLESLKNNKAGRASRVKEEIDFVLQREDRVSILLNYLNAGELPIRVTHNDTKFNNVLIDDITGEGICVLDLDTVMPGVSLYDFGDAIRSGTNTGEEDESDLSKVDVDFELFEQYVKGYLEEAGDILEPKEIELLHIAPQIMTLECGIRFLTDYLNGDIYFKVSRENHNLDRCRTQFKMVKIMEENEEKMKEIVDGLIKVCN